MPLRHVIVSRPLAGRTVLHVLQSRLRLPRPLLNQLLNSGQVRLDQRPCSSGKQKLRPGQRLSVNVPAASESPQAKKKAKARAQAITQKAKERGGDPLKIFARTWLPRIEVIYQDEHLLVVNKPAGLTTVRHKDELAELGRRQKYLPPTLTDLLPLLFKCRGSQDRIRAVHRLDRDTSGLLVFARTDQAERHLGRQFRGHTIERRYQALVRGRAVNERIESHLVPDRGDGRRGSDPQGSGQRAVTEVTVVEEWGDFTLVACRLETGRTHQVRIHLGERGTPLCGETIYDRPLHGQPLPDGSGARRPWLHAALLAVDHPVTGQRLTWECPLPMDMRRFIAGRKSGLSKGDKSNTMFDRRHLRRF